METVHPEPPLKDMTPLICYCDVCECVTVEECSGLECGCCTRLLNRSERRYYEIGRMRETPS